MRCPRDRCCRTDSQQIPQPAKEGVSTDQARRHGTPLRRGLAVGRLAAGCTGNARCYVARATTPTRNRDLLVAPTDTQSVGPSIMHEVGLDVEPAVDSARTVLPKGR